MSPQVFRERTAPRLLKKSFQPHIAATPSSESWPPTSSGFLVETPTSVKKCGQQNKALSSNEGHPAVTYGQDFACLFSHG